MKSYAPCLAVSLAGLALMIFAAVGLATQSDSRGGEAIRVVRVQTHETPRLPKQTGRTLTCYIGKTCPLRGATVHA